MVAVAYLSIGTPDQRESAPKTAATETAAEAAITKMVADESATTESTTEAEKAPHLSSPALRASDSRSAHEVSPLAFDHPLELCCC
jgi:hypothetical protein